MNVQDFKDLLKILPHVDHVQILHSHINKGSYHPDYRSTFMVYLVSHGLRPAIGIDGITWWYQKDVRNKISLENFFRERKLPLKIHNYFIYNIEIYDKKDLNQKHFEDFSQYAGRVLGYPEVLSREDFEELRSNKEKYKSCDVDYYIKHKGDYYWMNGWECFNSRNDTPYERPNYAQDVYNLLEPLGIEAVLKCKRKKSFRLMVDTVNKNDNINKRQKT